MINAGASPLFYFWTVLGVLAGCGHRERAPDALVDSWRPIFDPGVVAHFEHCGPSFSNYRPDIMASALLAMGADI